MLNNFVYSSHKTENYTEIKQYSKYFSSPWTTVHTKINNNTKLRIK